MSKRNQQSQISPPVSPPISPLRRRMIEDMTILTMVLGQVLLDARKGI